MKSQNALATSPGAPRHRLRHWLAPLIVLLALSGTASAAEGSFRHEVLMRGQVLDQENGGLVVCGGEADGAQVGQVLEVVRHKRLTRSNKASGPRYRRETVGQVRITGLFDTHYARAAVVTSKLKVNDTVELVRP